jgi:hypothetical protein
MGFQTKVNYQQAPAVAGDFASANTTTSMVAGEGQLTAGADGVTVGVFAWADPVTGEVSNTKMSGGRIGFVHREGQARITQWMGEAGNTIQAGQAMTLMTNGDFWVLAPNGATVGDAVLANDTTGAVAASGTDTGFKFASTCAAGELAKISTWG